MKNDRSKVSVLIGVIAILLIVASAILLIMSMLDGRDTPKGPQKPGITTSTGDSKGPDAEDPNGNNDQKEDVSHYIEEVYSKQIERYYTPLCEQWDVSAYFDNGLSMIASSYYTGNPLENVGYSLVDLDNDGSLELVIGAILNAEKDPSVFEIWTLVNGKPVMLAQGGSDNRYILQYVEEERSWYVANEASITMASHATYYMKLDKGELKVVQGIVFDAFFNEEKPWFLSHDLDGDVSNDTPISEADAEEILDSNRKLYKAPEYFPYTQYQPKGDSLLK